MNKSLKSDFSYLSEFEGKDSPISLPRHTSKFFILSASYGDDFSYKQIRKKRYSAKKILIYKQGSQKSCRKARTYSIINTDYINNLEGDLINLWKGLYVFKKIKSLKRLRILPSGFICPEFAMVKVFKKLNLTRLNSIHLGFISRADHRVIPRLIGQAKEITDVSLVRTSGFDGSFTDWVGKKTFKFELGSLKIPPRDIVSIRVDLPLVFLFKVQEFLSTLTNLSSLSLVSYSLQENDVIMKTLPGLSQVSTLSLLSLEYFGKVEEFFVFEILEAISDISSLKKFHIKADVEFRKRLKRNFQDLAKKLEGLDHLDLNLAPRSINFAVKRSYFDFFTRLIPLNHFTLLKLSLDCNFQQGSNSDIENFCSYIKSLNRLKVLGLQFHHRNILQPQWKNILNTICKLEGLEELELHESDYFYTNLDTNIAKLIPQKLQKLKKIKIHAVLAIDDERDFLKVLSRHPTLESAHLVIMFPQAIDEYKNLFVKLKECHIKLYTDQFAKVIDQSKNFIQRQSPFFSKFYSLCLKFTSMK